MAVAPNSTIRLLSNVPLDAAHRNTIYFSSVSAQTSYFSGQTAFTFSEYSYQRRERSVLVEASADALYQCNYMMYQNSSYTNKWFYAFIDAINYINDNCAEVAFTFDPLQSWWGSWNRGMCFIEREHSHTDNVGDNLLPDDLALGDYILDNVTKANMTSNLKVYIAATFDENFAPYYGDTVGNVYTGVKFNEFDLGDDTAIQNFISGATERQLSDGIVSIFIAPKMTGTTSSSPNVQNFSASLVQSGAIDGYTPRNNKLYTFPYNFLYVYTDSGLSTEYAYEYFSGGSADFSCYSAYSSAPELVLVPENYKGATLNLNEKMSLGGFPQCAYNIDSYKAWVAQNADGFWIQNAQNIANSLFGAGSYGVSSSSNAGVLSALNVGNNLANAGFSVAKDLNTINVLQRMPNAARGSSTGGATFTNDLKDFYFGNMHVRAEFARMIDDYWTMYGYPKRRVAIPDITARPQFTYTKTIGAYIYGEAPAADLQEIASYFDNGITFWKNPANVGNYSVNNSP